MRPQQQPESEELLRHIHHPIPQAARLRASANWIYSADNGHSNIANSWTCSNNKCRRAKPDLHPVVVVKLCPRFGDTGLVRYREHAHPPPLCTEYTLSHGGHKEDVDVIIIIRLAMVGSNVPHQVAHDAHSIEGLRAPIDLLTGRETLAYSREACRPI